MRLAVLLLLLVAGCDFASGLGKQRAKDPPITQDAKIFRAGLEIQRLEAEVLQYQATKGEWPMTWRALGRSATDPWGHEYLLAVSDDRPVVLSAGPDGDHGTDDDVFAAPR
jgi:hypothetical protein